MLRIVYEIHSLREINRKKGVTRCIQLSEIIVNKYTIVVCRKIFSLKKLVIRLIG